MGSFTGKTRTRPWLWQRCARERAWKPRAAASPRGKAGVVIGIGFVATRSGLFAKLGSRVLGKFVIHIALPALLFNAMAQRRIGEILNAAYVFSYLAGTLLMLALGWVWCRRRARLDASASSVTLGASSSAGMTRCVAMAAAPSTPQRMVLLINGLLCGG